MGLSRRERVALANLEELLALRLEVRRLKEIIGAWWSDPDNPPVGVVAVAQEVRPELFGPARP